MNKITLHQVSSLNQVCKKVDITESNSSLDNYYNNLSDSKTLGCIPPIKIDTDLQSDLFFFGKTSNNFNLKYPFQSENLFFMRNSRLIGDIYAIISNTNYLLSDSYYNEGLINERNYFLKNNLKLNVDSNNVDIPFALYKNSLKKVEINENVFLPLYYWHFNYHHWLIECLPRIRHLEKTELSNYKLLLPENMNQFQKDSITLLDIPEERIIYFDNQDYHFNNLAFSSLGNFSPEQLNWLKNKIYKKLEIKEKKLTKKIYISRSDAENRRIINEDKVIEALKLKGFEILTLTNLSFSEQVHIFSEAKIIVGPHGAGLSNIIFSGSEATVIEIMPNDKVNHCFWLLANSLSLNYSYLLGDIVNQNRDMKVDINDLKKIFDLEF